jgi:deoxyribonuclease-4
MAFHLNDSKKERGSHVDRHEHIGKGLIGPEAFGRLLNDERFKDLPMVIETPKDPEMKLDIMNLKALRDLIKPSKP